VVSDLKYVDVNGVRLAYAERITAGSTRPLVFVHGYSLRATGEVYDQLLSDLSRDFAVYALDLRGHGGSSGPHPGAWSLDAIADDVAAFVQALGLSGAVYVGHSIGGFTGLLAELRHPGVFPVMCLLATGPATGGRHNPAGIADLFIKGGRDARTMGETLAPMYVRADADSLRLAVEACALVAPAVHEAFFPEFQQASIETRLGDIASAVLLVNGARDVVIPPEEQHRTALGLRLCKEVTLSCEGHMLPIEAPAICAREIRAFVQHDADDLLNASG
jgi:3-oxoadipate enol-lactonase